MIKEYNISSGAGAQYKWTSINTKEKVNLRNKQFSLN
jgi:hypothetical protein